MSRFPGPHDNLPAGQLFEHAIPHMAEFHLKNTDPLYSRTFGFSPEERERGSIDLLRLKELLYKNENRFPVQNLVGYLEIGGPKVGRDYSDHHLKTMLVDSLRGLKAIFR